MRSMKVEVANIRLDGNESVKFLKVSEHFSDMRCSAGSF